MSLITDLEAVSADIENLNKRRAALQAQLDAANTHGGILNRLTALGADIESGAQSDIQAVKNEFLNVRDAVWKSLGLTD